MTLFKINLLLYVISFIGFAVVWRAHWVNKSTGENTIKLKIDDTAQGFNALIFKFLFIGQAVNVYVFAFAEDYYHWFSPIMFLEKTSMDMIGITLSWLALIWILVAQYQMSDSWRIGFDEEEKTQLKTKGLFRVSRNPIFFGILISNLSFLLILPNALTLCLITTSYMSIQTQVRLEEAYLSKVQGMAYLEYKEKVRRWL